MSSETATKSLSKSASFENSKKTKPTSEQSRIIGTKHRHVQVDARAGTGKTSVVVGRVERLVERGACSSEIMVATFSKAAAATLRLRLPTRVEVLTLHALGRRLAGQQSGRAGKRKLVGPEAALQLLRKALRVSVRELRKSRPKAAAFLRELGQDRQQRGRLLTLIALARTRGISTKKMAAEQGEVFSDFARRGSAASRVAKCYSTLKKQARVQDFADMIRLGRAALDHLTELPFKHLLVDEYQDCSPAQAQLVQALGKRMKSLMVLGDPFQTVFGFAGARFTALSSLLPKVRSYPLTRSFRLTEQNAALASTLISQRDRHAATIVGSNGVGEKTLLVRCTRAQDQELAVLEIIQGLIGRGVNGSDIAVLARTKAQLRLVEQRLLVNGIETNALYRELGTGHVLAVIAIQERLERLRKLADPGAGLDRLLAKIPQERDVPTTSLKSYKRKLKDSLQRSPETRYRACVTAYLGMLGGPKKKENMEVVAELNRQVASARRFDSAREFRRHVKKLAAGSRIQSSTIHRAKGGEWDHVVVLNVVEGALPFFMARTVDAREEELNLAYVAVTRARRRTYLIEAPYVHGRSGNEYEGPSPFFETAERARLFEVVAVPKATRS